MSIKFISLITIPVGNLIPKLLVIATLIILKNKFIFINFVFK